MIIMMYMWCIGRFERFERKQKIIAESNKMKMKVLFRPIVVLCEVYKRRYHLCPTNPYQIVSILKFIRMNSQTRSALAVAKRRASIYYLIAN